MMSAERSRHGKKVPVARIARAHGMKGEVRILPYLVQNVELLRQLPCFYRRKGRDCFEKLVPESIRSAPRGGFLVKFGEIDTRDEAEALHGQELFADLKDFPPPEEDEYYVFELVGLKVELPDGEVVGEVVGLMPVGPYELLEVRRPDGKTVYLPMVDEVIREIDLEQGKIVISPTEGLLEVQND
ncbi:MAG: 16S rRNA processing protein RimM [Thermodesulfobacteria bacterium]|nr:16S rRNA processing protein RimM [Thermodesulfobacteriota bacterium]